MSLRIGFDTSPLERPHPPGVVRATDGLVSALERRGVIEVLRLAPEPGDDLRRWRQAALPARVKRDNLVGIHSPVSAFPWRGPGARVQTVHELPWKCGVGENAGLRHMLWAALGPWRADRTLCPSEHTAALLRRRMLPGADKIQVVPWGVGPEFAEDPPIGEIDEVLLGRYRLGQDPLAVCLGAVREKKNLAALLRGLAAVVERKGPRIQLVVTGEETAQLRRDLGTASQLGLNRWVSTPGRVEEAHLPGLLRLASVVPVLSRSEGFAFPVLEALASGTPVLVPPDSAQAELAGDAGIVVDPDDPGSVADGLVRAIETREELRRDLVDRARPFTWEACAERVEAIWKDLA